MSAGSGVCSCRTAPRFPEVKSTALWRPMGVRCGGCRSAFVPSSSERNLKRQGLRQGEPDPQGGQIRAIYCRAAGTICGKSIRALGCGGWREKHMTELMMGFPPLAGGQVTLANWRNPPFNRWAFHHVRELIPSADIGNAAGRVHEWPEQPAALPINDLTATETDGMVVVHRGRIVYETYGPGVEPEAPHILMSVSKSMLGLLAGILQGRGMLDPEQPLTDCIPEL